MDNITISNVTEARGTLDYRQIVIPGAAIMAYNIFLALTIAFGTTGNLLVILVYAKFKVTSSTDVFILSITVFDFISSAINVPIYLTFTTGFWKIIGNDILCKLHMYLSQAVVLTSTYLICGLAFERYYKICCTKSSPLSGKAAKVFAIIVIIVMLILSTPSLGLSSNKGGMCVASVTQLWGFVYYLLIFMSFAVATVVVVFSYTKVVIAVKLSEANVKRHRVDSVRIVSREGYEYRNRNKIAPSGPLRDVTTMLNDVSKYTSTPHSRGLISSESSKRSGLSTPQDTTGEQSTSRSTGLISPLPSSSNGLLRNADVWTIQLSSDRKDRIESNRAEAHIGADTSTQYDSDRRRIRNSVFRSQLVERQKSIKTTKIAFLVCTIFIFTWIPPWVCFFGVVCRLMNDPTFWIFAMFGRMTYLVNTFANPFLYLGMNRMFKKRVLNVLKCR